MTFDEWWDRQDESLKFIMSKETAQYTWVAALYDRDNPEKCACGEPVQKLGPAWRGVSKHCRHCAPGPV